jgi:adenine specific DNA methylase Mod
VLFKGDNLKALGELAQDYEGKVTLAYLDPPFHTNRVHDARDRKSRSLRAAFDDRWPDRATFLETLGRRITATRLLLAPHGCMVLHVDPKTSHYVKVLCDEIFGEDAFASEIIWRYRRWPTKTPNFQRVHDVLLRYRKDPRIKPRFNPLFEPLAASTLATWGTRKQRAVFDATGRRRRSSVTPMETPGVPLGDVWEVGVIAPISRERTGYPSQKPEALLDRLVTALSDPDDLVLDPYAGSGTTLVVAAKQGRRFLGIDESGVAIETCRKRLRELGDSLAAGRPKERLAPRSAASIR